MRYETITFTDGMTGERLIPQSDADRHEVRRMMRTGPLEALGDDRPTCDEPPQGGGRRRGRGGCGGLRGRR